MLNGYLNRMEVADPDVLSLGLVHLHYRMAFILSYDPPIITNRYAEALLTYATTLAFYLNLRSSAKYTARPDLLRTHPIMSRLYRLKQSLTTLEELDFAPSDSDEEGDDEDADAFNLWNLDKMGGLDLDELRDLLADAGDNLTDLDSLPKPKGNSEPRLKIKIRGKGQTTVSAEGEDVGSTSADGPLKKKRKMAKSKSKHGSTDPTLPQFDLEEPTFPSTSKSKSTASNVKSSPKSVSSDPSYDPYGEHIILQQSDAQDKASRRRSLRFHTSKIESSSTKREKARASMGGDDDIPWKERKRVREDRLKREAEKKRGMGGDDLDDTEPEARGGIDEQEGAKKRKRNEEDGASDGSDGEGNDGDYYDLVKRQSKEKKEKKKVEYEAVQASLRYVVFFSHSLNIY